ncbi:hypothetical protein [Acinetobacter sp. YH01020]|uniref:hypothetical protein n=1 Tax=Acinetobacter sp. YH01020 TaxID=2601034 RepID=UPI0015D24E2B|nr:hypothetical protein [Acinetobacter sp. YH01020]
MADAIAGVDFDQLHDVIEEKLRAQFPAFQLVQFYRDEEERKAPAAKELPALLLELTNFEIDDQGDMGTEQLPLIARFEARIIDTFNQRRAKINVRKLAAGVALYIFQNKHFTQLGKYGVGLSTVEDISEDAFFPELDRFEVWRVDFSTQIVVGENIWKQEGITPIPVYSYVPRVGIPHKDEYKPLSKFKVKL